MSGTVLVLGGRSEIGVALARRLVADGRAATVVLAARRSDDLADETRSIAAAGTARVATVEFDADDVDAHAGVLDAVEREHGAPDTVVVAFGVLGDQRARGGRRRARARRRAHRLRRPGRRPHPRRGPDA